MLVRVQTVALDGIKAVSVEVEVDFSPGLPILGIVGLPEGAVREAKDRVRAALGNSGFHLPAKRIIINLAPAHLPKGGSSYDLPMALGLLVAMGKVPGERLSGCLFFGELSLDGRLRGVPGVLPVALFARSAGFGRLMVARENGSEAALVPDLAVFAPETLLDLVKHLMGEVPLAPLPATDWHGWQEEAQGEIPDLAEIKGQEYAKRALEIAAAGGHNMLMTGPPGSGKTFLARAMPGILPEMSLDEALEVTAIHSVAGRLSPSRPFVATRPFRSPHHTASKNSLVGGGGQPHPGEVSLAHKGVLFLDEIPEFSRTVLEVLREPLESGEAHISRTSYSARFPADFQLLAACNPCPCGHLGHGGRPCRCSPAQVAGYQSRLSGPLLDRIDLHVEVPPVPAEVLVALPSGESSRQVRARVMRARSIQYERNGMGIRNSVLNGKALEHHASLAAPVRRILLDAGQRMGFSARAHGRLLRVARTVADLAPSAEIAVEHMAEAIQFRIGGLGSWGGVG
ncbi:MAG: YifB family Mg chelatase-like AAA ATPase [Magnetococcales bacterium]|nr:YifB family Mg chelatase-like AAA ATPase [Magnetococcales bacterium]MBF0149914.1 YifB family Mg chelatase-like AAA ATPase [Magnetococcales bacterium]MBF0172917.1 YifB family Mg chelatase-like AAA ATPase [Magnetococcales bacterium]MBF0630430.1 YifB family Mg chelatase-like AAA ATPase [Magnetococcales bacterium]